MKISLTEQANLGDSLVRGEVEGLRLHGLDVVSVVTEQPRQAVLADLGELLCGRQTITNNRLDTESNFPLK